MKRKNPYRGFSKLKTSVPWGFPTKKLSELQSILPAPLVTGKGDTGYAPTANAAKEPPT
ncbi:MAG: hypothetical protein V7K18_22485 [Nostoc sp.]